MAKGRAKRPKAKQRLAFKIIGKQKGWEPPIGLFTSKNVVHFVVYDKAGSTVDRLVIDSDSYPSSPDFAAIVSKAHTRLSREYPSGKYAVRVVSSSSASPITLDGTSGSSLKK